ncbi:MAG: TetR/AcrR family transcriptional regulator [Actinomycetota bacterium]
MTTRAMGDGLRARQRAATRDAIVDAFLELAHGENAVSISIPAVAERAGVSVRTVYRHFATKGDLQTAASLHYSDRAMDRMADQGANDGDYRSYLVNLWTDLAEQLPAVLAEHTTPAGRALRATRLPIARRMVADTVGPDLDPETVDLIIAITSSSMFLELVDRMGHDPTRAATLVSSLGYRLAEEARR